MPELPDVEEHRRRFDDAAAGRRVVSVRVPDPEILVGTTPQGLGRSLDGRRLAPARRHGEWLLLPTRDAGPKLLLHFRMTGRLALSEEASDDDAVVLDLEAAPALRYRTTRRLGRVHWLAARDDPASVTGPLGPDALELEPGELARLLEGRRGALKSALMDQAVVAGLGNELVDDILWRARIHPRRRVAEMGGEEHRQLETAPGEVLREAVGHGEVPTGPGWLNGRRGSEDRRCPDCDVPLERIRVAGRTTYLCPSHQPGG